jgi:DNA polymerase III epsilon subunit-like protein
MDFETGGRDPSLCEITQIGAVAMRPRDLKLYDTHFNMKMRPLEPDKLDPESLKLTKLTKEELLRAPHPQEVWHKFADWCSQFNLGGKTDLFAAPVMAGHNIVNFDMTLYERYSHKYGTLKPDKFLKKKVPGIFNNLKHYDTIQLLGYWTENLKDPRSLSLDNLRVYFGMPQASKDGAHDALQDVKDTAAILQKLLMLSRHFGRKVRFKNCFDLEAMERDREAEKSGAEAPDEEAKPKRRKKSA